VWHEEWRIRRQERRQVRNQLGNRLEQDEGQVVFSDIMTVFDDGRRGQRVGKAEGCRPVRYATSDRRAQEKDGRWTSWDVGFTNWEWRAVRKVGSRRSGEPQVEEQVEEQDDVWSGRVIWTKCQAVASVGVH